MRLAVSVHDGGGYSLLRDALTRYAPLRDFSWPEGLRDLGVDGQASLEFEAIDSRLVPRRTLGAFESPVLNVLTLAVEDEEYKIRGKSAIEDWLRRADAPGCPRILLVNGRVQKSQKRASRLLSSRTTLLEKCRTDYGTISDLSLHEISESMGPMEWNAILSSMRAGALSELERRMREVPLEPAKLDALCMAAAQNSQLKVAIRFSLLLDGLLDGDIVPSDPPTLDSSPLAFPGNGLINRLRNLTRRLIWHRQRECQADALKDAAACLPAFLTCVRAGTSPLSYEQACHWVVRYIKEVLAGADDTSYNEDFAAARLDLSTVLLEHEPSDANLELVMVDAKYAARRRTTDSAQAALLRKAGQNESISTSRERITTLVARAMSGRTKTLSCRTAFELLDGLGQSTQLQELAARLVSDSDKTLALRAANYLRQSHCTLELADHCLITLTVRSGRLAVVLESAWRVPLGPAQLTLILDSGDFGPVEYTDSTNIVSSSQTIELSCNLYVEGPVEARSLKVQLGMLELDHRFNEPAFTLVLPPGVPKCLLSPPRRRPNADLRYVDLKSDSMNVISEQLEIVDRFHAIALQSRIFTTLELPDSQVKQAHYNPARSALRIEIEDCSPGLLYILISNISNRPLRLLKIVARENIWTGETLLRPTEKFGHKLKSVEDEITVEVTLRDELVVPDGYAEARVVLENVWPRLEYNARQDHELSLELDVPKQLRDSLREHADFWRAEIFGCRDSTMTEVIKYQSHRPRITIVIDATVKQQDWFEGDVGSICFSVKGNLEKVIQVDIEYNINQWMLVTQKSMELHPGASIESTFLPISSGFLTMPICRSHTLDVELEVEASSKQILIRPQL
ncbi:hypothetical protein PYCC9005_005096 [Savitreella phatthalungensis]